MKKPLVSVIIPTFNRQYCLGRAIESVMAQSYANLELIVVNDGSTDSTKEWLQIKYPDIRVIDQEHSGVSKARNTGVKSAKGNWLAFLDSDDAWAPNKISVQMHALLSTEPQFLICHSNEIWFRNGIRVNPMKKHEKKGGWIFNHCLAFCMISPSSVVMHKSLFEELNGFDETLPACEDYDLWLRVATNWPVLYIKDPLTIKYGGHSDQLSKKYWGMDRFRILALQKIIQNDSLSASNRKAAINTLCEKIMIVLQGARKRNKKEQVKYYEQLLQYYHSS